METMYLTVDKDLDKFEDDVNYASIIDGEVCGFSVGFYIKEHAHEERIRKCSYTEVTPEIAMDIAYNL